MARAALSRSETYLSDLNGLPELKEFQPPWQHLYLLRLAEHKQQAAMMKKAEESSVLLGLFSRLPLKYGRSFFIEREGEFTEPSKLGSYSLSAEKPRGEMLDPVGQMLQRARWQAAGLLEAQDRAQDETDEDHNA